METYRNNNANENNIARLVSEFGEEYRDHITTVYNAQLEILTKEASIQKYVPVFTEKITRQILLAEQREGYLEKKIKKMEDRWERDGLTEE
jgi:uncharacterized protein involved in exopolysaccharide biosynthesis